MEHTQAVHIGATERYLLGELVEDECAAFEEHYFSCPECAADVRAAAALAQRARELLRDEESRSWAAPARPFAGRAATRPRGLAGWFFPLPLGAAAALLLAVLGLGWQSLRGRELRRELQQATAPQPARWAFLSVSRSRTQAIEVGRGERWLGLTLSRSSSESFPYYRFHLARADRTPLLEWTQPGPEPGDEVQVALPLRELAPGHYTLTVAGLSVAEAPARLHDAARYDFSLRFRGE